MAYYKLELELMEGVDRMLLLETLSLELQIPIEPTQIWRSNRNSPFLQMIDTDIYIRHIRDLTDDEKDEIIGTANHIIDDYDTRTNYTVLVPNKVGSLTFKFFH